MRSGETKRKSELLPVTLYRTSRCTLENMLKSLVSIVEKSNCNVIGHNGSKHVCFLQEARISEFRVFVRWEAESEAKFSWEYDVCACEMHMRFGNGESWLLAERCFEKCVFEAEVDANTS